jgi:hypothetical protein
MQVGAARKLDAPATITGNPRRLRPPFVLEETMSLKTFFDAVGHDVKIVFIDADKIVSNLPKFIAEAKDAEADVKQVVPLVQAVVTAALALAKPAVAVGAAVGSAGVNLAADETAIASLISAGPQIESGLTAFVAAVKALAQAIGADWTALIAELDAPAATATPAS